MKNKKENREEKWDDEQNDATKYGEFVPSYFYWITPEQQRERVERLNEATNINARNREKKEENKRK